MSRSTAETLLRLEREAWGREADLVHASTQPALAGAVKSGQMQSALSQSGSSPAGATRGGVLHAAGYEGAVPEGWRRGQVEAGRMGQ